MENNDGSPHVLTAKDVPVRAFWSVIVYDADGFIPENDLGVYSYNNITAEPKRTFMDRALARIGVGDPVCCWCGTKVA